MPPFLIIFVVIGVILAIFCFAMAIISAIAKRSASTDKLAIRLDANKLQVASKLSNDGFKVSKKLTATQLIFVSKKITDNEGFDSKDFVEIFIDEENKKLAVATYNDGAVKYFSPNEIKGFDVFVDSKTNSKETCLKKLNLIFYTNDANEPIYTVKVLLFRIYSVSKKYTEFMKFKDDVTKAVTEFIESK